MRENCMKPETRVILSRLATFSLFHVVSETRSIRIKLLSQGNKIKNGKTRLKKIRDDQQQQQNVLTATIITITMLRKT